MRERRENDGGVDRVYECDVVVRRLFGGLKGAPVIGGLDACGCLV